MKQKVYCLLTLAGLACLTVQSADAQETEVKQPDSKVVGTLSPKKITIAVKDFSSSRLLDSVQVVMGKESKYSNSKGIVVFENNSDSVIILSKPGYSKTGKKITSSFVTVRLMKADKSVGGYFVNTGLSQNAVELFSGSATTVTGENLRKVSSLSLIDGLKFYIPSLFVLRSNNNGDDPNVLPQIRLRGATSIPFPARIINGNVISGVQTTPSTADYVASSVRSNSGPLILLDGIQVSAQTILDIDLNRINNVVVLKDAAATASYGMRGSNGVIAVQTNKPQGKFEISFSEQLQIASPDLSSFRPLSSKQKLDIEKNSGIFNGVLEPVYLNRYNQAYNNNVNTDWLSMPLRNGVGTKHSLALNAGNDDIVYGLNAAYNDVEGVMKGSSRKNLDLGAYFGGRLGALTFNNKFSYLGSNAANSEYGEFNSYVKMNPYWQSNDPLTGKVQKIVELNTIGDQLFSFVNPAYNASLSTLDHIDYARFSNLTNLNWIIGSGFQLNGVASITKQSDELNYFLPPNHTVFKDITPDNLFKRGLYEYTSNSFMDVQGGLRLQYQQYFNKHHIFVNVGQSVSQTSSESESIAVRGFAADRLADIGFGIGYAIPKPVSGKIMTRYASTFGNVAYSYDSRYQVDLTGSKDFYSGLDKGAGFGAIGFSWNVNNEEFLKPVKWIDLLKIKGSFGISGNQGFLSYLNRTTYDYYTNQQYIPTGSGLGTIGIGLGAYLTGYASKNLQSPETFKQDIGIDAAFFNNRVAFNFNTYRQLNYRMVLPVHSPASSGYQNFSYYDNYGEIENTGFEMGVMARVYQSDRNKLRVSLMANAFHSKDKITASGPYLNDQNDYNDVAEPQNIIQPKYVVGRSPFAIWAVPSLGIDPQSGKEIFQKKDGTSTMIWDAADKVFAGNLTPDWSGSFGTEATFRQFSFAAFFNYQFGAKVYNQTMADIENAGVNDNLDARVFNSGRWVPGMTNAKYKGLFNSSTYATTRLVENDNKIQCSSILLGYMLPKVLAEKVKAKRLELKCMVNNAFDIGGADMQRGIYYPFQRSYTFILNANF
ncbi:SusC/RagA family TonB-linked outer membrane protein [Pedobacter nyackensis]|uniref:SusC/RagA family TonB-linked outer membrane protein n=1 Tax=Pedobacter nyackensis TaxID=475255 RepID=UPI0029316C5F|nr:SusC/RagA family TonB-linked outer membrane protein [Pedobacter nyackensis]